jgi:hypothetical protein
MPVIETDDVTKSDGNSSDGQVSERAEQVCDTGGDEDVTMTEIFFSLSLLTHKVEIAIKVIDDKLISVCRGSGSHDCVIQVVILSQMENILRTLNIY